MKNVHKRTILVLTIPLFLMACADDSQFEPGLKNSQNPEAYVNPKTAHIPILSSQQEKETYQAFLRHYYSPWHDKSTLFTSHGFKEFVESSTQNYTHRAGYNENHHRHSQEWISNIIKNINFSTFPNHLQNAIIIRSTFERTVPTNKPSFTSLEKPGFTYPFDDYENSFLPANLPVKIIQVSKNKAWDYVQTHGSAGWVKANDLANVDKKFIKTWQKNKGYIEVKSDQVPIIDQHNIFRFMSHMGAIYPIQSETDSDYIIRIAIKNLDGKAIISTAKIAKAEADKIPLLATPDNIAKIAKRFIGMPYAWGGLYGYRDCSATMEDLFSYFGVWLPRDSTQQAELGQKSYSVKNLSDAQKLNKLREHGLAFFTLVHLDGHIMLYLGKKDGQYYVLHDMWGLKTKHWFKEEGRAVVGKTVITPIDFGKKYLNVKESLLDRMIGFRILPS